MKEDPDTCYHMGKAWGRHPNQNKAVTERQIQYDSTYMKYLKVVKLIETKYNGGCQELEVGGNGE